MNNTIGKQVLFAGYRDKFFEQVLKGLSNNIEPLYLSDVKSMKGNIRDILSKRSDFKDEDYDYDC